MTTTKDGTLAMSSERWRELRQRLLAFTRRRVNDEALAEDIVHDVLTRGYHHLGELRDPERLGAWLYQATRNAIIDRHRSSRPTDPLGESLAAPEVDDTGEVRSELARCVEPLLETLPAHYREAVALAELDELPQREVAVQLGLSLSGAKARIQRGRRLLAAALHACCTIELDARRAPMAYAERRAVCAEPRRTERGSR